LDFAAENLTCHFLFHVFIFPKTKQKNIDAAPQAGVWNTNRKLEKMGDHRVYNIINNF
jgi:hypothetical protein